MAGAYAWDSTATARHACTQYSPCHRLQHLGLSSSTDEPPWTRKRAPLTRRTLTLDHGCDFAGFFQVFCGLFGTSGQSAKTCVPTECARDAARRFGLKCSQTLGLDQSNVDTYNDVIIRVFQVWMPGSRRTLGKWASYAQRSSSPIQALEALFVAPKPSWNQMHCCCASEGSKSSFTLLGLPASASFTHLFAHMTS
jgi:hypothetical protein